MYVVGSVIHKRNEITMYSFAIYQTTSYRLALFRFGRLSLYFSFHHSTKYTAIFLLQFKQRSSHKCFSQVKKKSSSILFCKICFFRENNFTKFFRVIYFTEKLRIDELSTPLALIFLESPAHIPRIMGSMAYLATSCPKRLETKSNNDSSWHIF